MTKLTDPVPEEFRSKVPDNLRRSMKDSDRDIWLADTLSVLDQKVDWTMSHLIETMRVASESEKTLARWRNHIENPIKVAIAFLLWMSPWILDWITGECL